MTRSFRITSFLGLAALLAGCAIGRPEPLALYSPTGELLTGGGGSLPAEEVPDAAVAEGADALAETAVVADEDVVAPDFPPVNGITVASLGDATDPGMWIETPFAQIEMPGRVISESGRIVEVTLRPSGGALGSGSRLSLAAMQALGLSLTDLATVTVTSQQ